MLGQPRAFVLDHAYTGPGYSNATFVDALNHYDLRFRELDEDQLTAQAAHIVAKGDVLGWFQGRMEWGREHWATAASLPIPDGTT